MYMEIVTPWNTIVRHKEEETASVMVSVFTSSTRDSECEFHFGQTNNHPFKTIRIKLPSTRSKTNAYYPRLKGKLSVKEKIMIQKMCVCLVVFNATFNNISVISWLSVLPVEKIRDLSQVTYKLYHIMYTSPERVSNSQL
jgi:hypothetical protein